MAFINDSRLTISAMKDWRAGMSTVFTTPRSVASTARCQYRTSPVQTSADSVKAWRSSASCVPMMRRRLGSRSVSAPATTAKKSIGANWSALRRPSLNGELVSSSTSQACPTDCIQVPMRDTSWPPQNRRKSRCCSARSASGRAMSHRTTTPLPSASAAQRPDVDHDVTERHVHAD